jgi:hypothetical protein
MTIHRKLAAALLPSLLLVSAAGRSSAAPPPGPPWPVNYPTPKERPATDAPDKNFASATVEANGAPVGVAVTVIAAVARPKLGNKYELYYQLRVHTGKGETGPLLSTRESPEGKPFLVKQVTCEYDWIEFYEKFDVVRKDITGMINMPSREEGGSDKEVVIRVEPQIWDVAEKKFLTPGKTPAAILVAGVGAHAKVWKLQSLSSWLTEKVTGGSDPRKALEVLAELDEFSSTGNGVEEALLAGLNAKDVPTSTKVLYVHAVPATSLHAKTSFYLKRALEELAAGAEGELKTAARKKLDEAK